MTGFKRNKEVPQSPFKFKLRFKGNQDTACIPDGKVHHCVQLVPPTAVVGETL